MTSEQVIQLLTDNGFKKWVLNPQDEALKIFWEKWLSDNSLYGDIAADFKLLILKMHYQEDHFDSKTEQNVWQNIQNTLSETAYTEGGNNSTEKPRHLYRAWMGIAAGIALFIMAAFFYFNKKNTREIVLQTAYGETRSLTLPDGSEVILNANSVLKWTNDWQIGKDRTVYLTGEAFFVVNEQGESTHRDRFIVHTPNLDVEVKGTRFNVNTYRPQTQVVLQKGSVEIKTRVNNKEKKYSLAPEQRAVFNSDLDKMNISQVNFNAFLGWKDKRFIFDNTPLSEVAIMLENTYGFRVIIENEDLKNKLISGEIPTSERKALLLALSTLYSLKINEQSKDTLLISK
jgi:transmembrane sensor